MKLGRHILIVAAAIGVVVVVGYVLSIDSDKTGPVCVGIAWVYFGILGWSHTLSAPQRARKLVRYRHRVSEADVPAFEFPPVQAVRARRAVGRVGVGRARFWLVLLWLLFLPLFLLAAAMTFVGLVGTKTALISFYRERLRRARARIERFYIADSDEANPADHRQAVILLRSFADDELRVDEGAMFLGKPKSFEEYIIAQLARIGPVVAVGRPAENLPPLGAPRKYLRDAEWQEYVRDQIRNVRLIVAIAGTSPGFLKEVEMFFQEGLLSKVILVIPPVSARERKSRLLAFASQTRVTGVFDEPNDNLLSVAFSRTGQPIAIDGPERTGAFYAHAIALAAAVADAAPKSSTQLQQGSEGSELSIDTHSGEGKNGSNLNI